MRGAPPQQIKRRARSWNRQSTIGLIATLTLLAFIVAMEFPGIAHLGQHQLQVHALFQDVLGLRNHAQVRVAGVLVGYVQRLELRHDLGTVDVTIALTEPNASAVRTDSTASIGFNSRFQTDHLELTYGSPSAPNVENGSYLQAKERADPQRVLADVDRTLAGIAELGGGWTPEKVHALLDPLASFLNSNRNNLTATLAGFQWITGAMAHGRGTVGRLLTDEALLHNLSVNLMRKLQTATESLRGLALDGRATLAGPRLDQGTIGASLRDKGRLYNEASLALITLDQILTNINQGNGTASRFLNEDTVYLQIKKALPKMERAVESVEDQGPMSVLGIAAGKLKGAIARP